MDLFNRPPAISEDTLQYILYPPVELSDKASVTTLAACVQTFVDSLLPDFLWHRDAFQLKVVSDPDKKDASLLEGRMRVGDCVDDEWCTVYLLREISAKWDVVISVFDSDGEFLLIEAADALPSWVKPTNSENRVWIYRSCLHLIPLSHVSPPSRPRRLRKLPGTKESDDEGLAENDSGEYLAPVDAVRLVRDQNVDTLASRAVEDIVWQRIAGYPAALRDHVHITKAWLPADIAKALSVDLSLVQKPVETFYTRDAIQLRAAHRMSRFPPEPSVLITVKMTRTAYAQLVGQKFYPPKIFSRWQEREGTKEWRWRDVGMKLACGFEMLYQESKNRSDVSNISAEVIKASSDARKDALLRNPDYVKYTENLVSVGYFRGELQGSQLWNELEDKAAATFIEVRKEDDATRPSFASLVNLAVSRAGENPVIPEAEEDSDEWLNIDAQDFDDMLQLKLDSTIKKSDEHSEKMDVDEAEDVETAEKKLAREQASRLQELAQKVEEFVEGQGDVQGATFEDEQSSDDEELSEEEFSDAESNRSEEHETADQAERQAAMDKLVPPLQPSEYGEMPPAFYSNSQRVAKSTVTTDVVEDNTQSSGSLPTKPIRAPILTRDKYEGVDSDDETDEEEGNNEDDESEDEQPQVVGDVEVDMDEEEAEFLEFSRQALGISDEQWRVILHDRESRGAFIPSTAKRDSKSKSLVENENLSTDDPRAQGHRPNANPNLNSFEAVMRAMDAELAQSRKAKSTRQPDAFKVSGDKGKSRAMEVDDEGDIEAKMDAELKAVLERGEDDEDEGEEEGMDYNLIKNFLESFKSQGGLSGPVSNLAGRLQPGWTLPRDES